VAQAQRAIQNWRPALVGGPSDPLAHVRALHRQAVAESSAMRPVAAARLLRAALRALDHIDAAADVAEVGDGSGALAVGSEATTVRLQVLITLAKVDAELRGSRAGMARLEQATGLLDRGPEPAVVVALHNQLGVLNIRFGRLRAAVVELDRAERLFSAAGPLDQANVLLNRATARMLLGELAAADRDLQQCARVAADAQLPVLQYMSTHNRGYLQFLRGDLPGALQVMDDARRLGGEIEGVALLDRARVLVEAGLSSAADETLAAAGAVLRRDRMAQDLGEVELARAECALVRGRVADARRLAAAARDRFRRRGSDSWRRAAELTLLQADLAAGRPPRRLIPPAERLQAELAAEGLRLPARTAALIATEALLGDGRTAAAAATLAGLGRARRGDPITARMHWRLVSARVALETAEPRRAAGIVRTGLDELAAHQSRFGSIDLQTATAVHGRRLADLGLALAVRGGQARPVFVAAERARAASSRLPALRPPADEAAAELLAELRRTVELLRDTSRAPAAAARLRRRRVELEREIVARGWTQAGAGDVRRVAGVEPIRAELAADDSEMIMFAEVGDALHAVVVGRGVRLCTLGAAGWVSEQVRRVRADLDVLAHPGTVPAVRAAVLASLRRSLAALDESLCRPLGLGNRRVVVVSTGVLGQLPWAALPSLRGVPLVVAPSATGWLAALTQPRRPGPVHALAGPDLARAGEEVAAVRAAWGDVRSATGARADRAALRDALAGGGLVHVAAHGTHQTDNPLFSSLRLADGVSFAHELDPGLGAPEHVVLSACELGLATVRPGDEAIGLTSVLLRLGARSVVSGIARVGDAAAAATMTAYHQRLAAGDDSATALARALDHGGPDADVGPVPFVCFGSAWRPPSSGRDRPGPPGDLVATAPVA
jgi:hypothetical protein